MIAFDYKGDVENRLKLKSGANAIIVWFREGESKLTEIEQARLNSGSQRFVYSAAGTPEEFRVVVENVLKDRDLVRRMEHQEKTLLRLNLIHELTRTALSLGSEVEIREFVMNRMATFYNAPSCTYLEYGADNELYVVSQLNSRGVTRHGLNRKISDKKSYEECVRCGDPIINCSSGEDNQKGFFCAPVISDDKTVGLIRIRYVSPKVEIAVDRMVLRVAADILAAAKIRQSAQIALRASEQKASTILDTTVDAIITINSRGSIQTFNQAAEDLFGYKMGEVAGKNVHVLMPSPYKEEHDGYMKNYQRTGERQIIGIGREVTGRRKDGSTFPMYLAVSEYEVEGKQMFTGVVRDMTEERQLEQEVMRISEHERHRIGQDLHDGLGQMLSGIGLLSRRVANKLETEGHELADDMNEIRDLIKEADEYSRGLARGLVKIDLDRGGFTAAIEKLVRQSERLFRIKCELSVADEVDISERTRAEHVYRIIQEAINNAVKHGEASEVKVIMTMGHHLLRISIKDNGTGFPKNWRSQQGLGVRIMEFRSRLIGAHFEQHNHSEGGAIITCSVPNP
ncbi:MAG: PAS domain S-box protein [Balneolia bacterium]|nr:PAS domain S-box protein [Balneolia bacterium]